MDILSLDWEVYWDTVIGGRRELWIMDILSLDWRLLGDIEMGGQRALWIYHYLIEGCSMSIQG